ncbi:MAG TPA: class I SAM-dependent methyltransferase [Candidatus Binataceae bacterium]|nr:class I SAM-dependent methyltransferase [Candidatus Binataceae bacterium]
MSSTHDHSRHGAKQPERFDPARAAKLDDPARFEHLPPGDVTEMLAAPQGACVIDFGTGTGTYAIELATRRPDLQVIALDEQPEMLDLLRAKPAAAALKNLRPVLTDALPELQGKADRILAINVLHELGDEALSGLVALLKPEGRVLFIDWRADVERPVGPPRDHVYNVAEARKRVEGFGLLVEHQHLLQYHYVLLARRS